MFKFSLAGALLGAVALQAAPMSVQIQDGHVRSQPSFLGRVVETVRYGQKVEVVAAQGAWRQVKTPSGQTGWLHEAALSAKRLSAQSGGQVGAGASGDELALAGKGFSADVEERFKAAHSEADFASVDKMSAMTVTPEACERFVAEGGLARPGGGR